MLWSQDSITFYGKQSKSCGLPLSLTPKLNTLHQNDTPVMCRVMGDNYIYRYIHLIKELKNTTSESQSNALLLLVTALSPFGLLELKLQIHIT